MSDHRAAGSEWVARATADLLPVTEPAAVVAGQGVAWADRSQLDARSVIRAGRCLWAADPDPGEFVESVPTARRRVGLAVLARMKSHGLDPRAAFDAVVADAGEVFAPGLADWIAGLGPAGVAALGAEASSYAAVVGASGAVAASTQAVVQPGGSTFDWDVPRRSVRVRGRCDVMSPPGARPPDRRLLVVVGSLADASVEAAHAALAYTLNRCSVPASVTVLAPAEGSRRFRVDDDLLGGALERLMVAAHAAMAARFGPPAPTTPGPWCRWCARAGECDDGRTWVEGHPRRHGGLLAVTPPGHHGR